MERTSISRSEDTIDQREHLIAYLLRELSPEQEEALERDYLSNDAAYEQLLAVENELAYDYLQDFLAPDRRIRFESSIGATERGRQNLEFARLLLRELEASRPRSVRAGRYRVLAIAAAIAGVCVPVWLAFRVSSLTSQLEQLQSESSAMRARLESRIAQQNATPPLEVAFVLTPGISRSEGSPTRVSVPGTAGTIRFELAPPPGAATGQYIVTAETSGGAEFWSQTAALSGPTLVVRVPAALFTGGNYEITVRRLTAGERAPDLATYSFALARP